jgi:hypothetical protein
MSTRVILWIGGAALALVLAAWFTLRVAGPNIIDAGIAASEQAAVSTLRTVLWAEDLMRDQRGRPGLIGELSGAVGVDGGPPLAVPLLREPFRNLVAGPAGESVSVSGYMYAVFVLGPDGRPVTDGQGTPPAGAKRFIAYAWPAVRGHSGRAAYCIDQDEDLLETPNDAPGQAYDGPSHPPAWDACLTAPALPDHLDPGTGRDGGAWARWKGRLTKRAQAARG